MSLAFPFVAQAADVSSADVVAQSDSQKNTSAASTAGKTLPNVVVTSRPSATQQGALRDEIVKTESIDAAEIAKTGATNLTELMAHRPGIDVQVECSVCNVRNITLNNLPGRFTTLMLDGVPIFSSVSNAYGLDMIGLNGLERVDISRGAGTSLIAPESLAGTVNLVTKRPTRDGGEVDLSGGSDGFRRGAAYAAKTFQGGAFSVSGTLQQHDSVDGVGTGISQYTGYDRKLLGLGLFLDDVGGFRIKTRFDHIDEKRMGGPLGDDYDAVRASTSGNPFDFSKGPHASPDPNGWINPSDGSFVGPYDDGRFGLAQIIFTKRDQFAGTAERQIGDAKLRLAGGYAEHRQDSWYGGDADYFGRQKQYYLESSVQMPIGRTLWTAGLNYRYEDLHSRSTSEDPSSPTFGIERIDADAYVYRTPGAFLQMYRTFFDDRLEINASVRYDHNNVYGGITTPRLNMLWHHSDNVSSRFAIGSGYRFPTSFFELEHAILAAPSVDRSQARPEKSDNVSYAWNYANDRFAVTASINHTRIRNLALFVDDTAVSGNFLLQPAASAYTVNNVDVVGTWQITPRDAFTAGFERYQYRFNATDMQGSLFARPDYRVTLALDHDAGPWDINARATLTGPANLAKFYDYADTQRYNLDGTPKPNRSPSFWVVDLRASYQWNKTIQTYLGIDNVFDYKQASRDSFLWLDAGGALDVTHIWGPNIGRTMVAGVKLSF
ncbi:MAG TPA: TonB-dependent receptor [Ramlibacter sp.]|uniref:TonB-dependent receptor plug domain-containing protein n=1 Tax=Ramlibacter sp. TaxID=1917967 RepID=UPI002BECF9E2|nr:TonB-dependent receptor [Ramlibacter sp.]HVZ44500.1 TonB-dependent receptor [Ramlibacter sp.]